eukprot:m51a1_g8881 putative protein (1732) ;mRNA; r:637216-644206
MSLRSTKVAPEPGANDVRDIELNNIAGTSSEASYSSGTSYAWSDSFETGFWKTSYSILMRISYAVMTQRAPRWMPWLVAAVELLAVLCAPISLVWLRSSPAWGDAITQIPRYVHDASAPTESQRLVVAYALLAAAAVYVAAMGLEFADLRRGGLGHQRVLRGIKLLAYCVRAVVMPAAGAFLGLLLCRPGVINARDEKCAASGAGLRVALGAVGLALVGAVSAHDSLFHVDVIPAKSAFAQSTARVSMVLWAAKAALVGLDALETTRTLVHCIVIALLLGAMTIIYGVFMPFYKYYWNLVYVSVFAAATWAAVIAVVAAGLEAHSTVVPFALCLAGLVPAGATACVATMMRMRSYRRKFMAELPPLAYPFQVDLTLRRCYNQRGGELDPSVAATAVRIATKAKEQFPESPFVHLLHGVLLIELQNDPRGTIVHSRTAKRLDTMFDMRYLTSCFIQHAHDCMQDESGKRDVDVQLEAVERHHRLAKANAAKFWQELVRTRENTDAAALLKIVTVVDEHDKKAFDILTNLLRKILRAYARFMGELRNDKEAANQAYILADQCEEEAAAKQAKAVERNRAKNRERESSSGDLAARGVRFGEGTLAQTRAAVNGPHDDDGAGRTRSDADNSDSKSFTSSIMSSASAAGSDELAQFRSIKRRLESAKSSAIDRLHVGIVAGLVLLQACIIIEYATSTSQLNIFMSHISMMNKSIGCRQDLYTSMYYARRMEAETLAAAGALSDRCSTVVSKTRSVETAFDDMFQMASVSPAIAALWAQPRNAIRFYIPGVQSDVYANGTYDTYYYPLWDGAYTVVNNLYQYCNPATYQTANYSATRTDPVFRAFIDNGPYSVLATLQDLGNLFAVLVEDDSRVADRILYIVLPLSFGACVVTVGLIWLLALRSIHAERVSATRLFYDIPKSAMLNIVERLASDKDHDAMQAVVRRSSLSTPALVQVELTAAVLVLFGLVAAIFGVILSFTQSYSSIGIILNAAGTRRNLVGAMRFWTQELAVDDPTTGNYTGRLALTQSLLAQFDKLDADLKYGNATEGIYSYIKKDKSLYDLWYTRPCPAELNLTDCAGLGILLRRFVDEVKYFVAAPQALATLGNAHYQQALSLQIQTSAWLLDGISAMYLVAVADQGKAASAIRIVLGVSVPLTIALYIFLRIGVAKLSTEIERLFKMLLFVPPSVLDSVATVKDFIESGSNVSSAHSDNSKAQEQQTKNILDACEDAVVVCGAHGVIEIFNPAAERITGYAAEDALGRNVSMILPEDLGSNQRVVAKIFRAGHEHGAGAEKKIASQEVVLRTRDGKEFTSLLSVSRSTVRTKTTHALFIRDISAIKEHEQAILHQQRRAEALLCNILPRALVKQLSSTAQRGKGNVIAQSYEEVTILFADIVGFTQMSSTLDPEELVLILNTLVSEWDRYAMELGVEKIKTIGDCYMAATGVPIPFPEHAEVMMEFAITMLETLACYNRDHKNSISLRIGVNTGRVVAGVLGLHKIAYDLWGDSVNVASRMESSGFPNRIQVSDSTYEKLKDRGYQFEPRGKVDVKGRGNVDCYLFDPTTLWGAAEPPAPSLSASMRNARLKKRGFLGSGAFGGGLSSGMGDKKPQSPATSVRDVVVADAQQLQQLQQQQQQQCDAEEAKEATQAPASEQQQEGAPVMMPMPVNAKASTSIEYAKAKGERSIDSTMNLTELIDPAHSTPLMAASLPPPSCSVVPTSPFLRPGTRPGTSLKMI